MAFHLYALPGAISRERSVHRGSGYELLRLDVAVSGALAVAGNRQPDCRSDWAAESGRRCLSWFTKFSSRDDPIADCGRTGNRYHVFSDCVVGRFLGFRRHRTRVESHLASYVTTVLARQSTDHRDDRRFRPGARIFGIGHVNCGRTERNRREPLSASVGKLARAALCWQCVLASRFYYLEFFGYCRRFCNGLSLHA